MVHHIHWEDRVLIPILLYDPDLDLVSVIFVYMFFLLILDHHFLLQNPCSLPYFWCDHAILSFTVMPWADLRYNVVGYQLDQFLYYSSDSIAQRSNKGFPSHHKVPKNIQARKKALSYIQLLDQPYHMGSLWICFLPTALLLWLRSLSLLLPQ